MWINLLSDLLQEILSLLGRKLSHFGSTLCLWREPFPIEWTVVRKLYVLSGYQLLRWSLFMSYRFWSCLYISRPTGFCPNEDWQELTTIRKGTNNCTDSQVSSFCVKLNANKLTIAGDHIINKICLAEWIQCKAAKLHHKTILYWTFSRHAVLDLLRHAVLDLFATCYIGLFCDMLYWTFCGMEYWAIFGDMYWTFLRHAVLLDLLAEWSDDVFSF